MLCPPVIRSVPSFRPRCALTSLLVPPAPMQARPVPRVLRILPSIHLTPFFSHYDLHQLFPRSIEGWLPFLQPTKLVCSEHPASWLPTPGPCVGCQYWLLI